MGGGFDGDGGRRGDERRELCGEDCGERLRALVFLGAALHFCRHAHRRILRWSSAERSRRRLSTRLRRPCAPPPSDRRRPRRCSHRGGCSPFSRRPAARSRETIAGTSAWRDGSATQTMMPDASSTFAARSRRVRQLPAVVDARELAAELRGDEELRRDGRPGLWQRRFEPDRLDSGHRRDLGLGRATRRGSREREADHQQQNDAGAAAEYRELAAAKRGDAARCGAEALR